MKYITRVNQHGSNVYLYVDDLDQQFGKSFVKASSMADGVNIIKNEREGIDWYNQNSPVYIPYRFMSSSPYYAQLRIKFFSSDLRSSQPSYSNYRYLIRRVLTHYCSTWSSYSDSELSPMHGDFSLSGNILMSRSNECIVIDWEHFRYNAAPIGFDMLNCLFELIYYEQYKREILNDNLLHLSEMIQLLKCNNCLHPSFHVSPLSTLINFMYSRKHFWQDQLYKFPVLKFEIPKIDYIDTFLNSRF